MSSIVTFYSYKGGVGRSMALANIAVLLARRGLKVLTVDWDLEAPGLDRYFADLDIKPGGPGLLRMFMDARDGRPADYKEFASSIACGTTHPITLLASGEHDESYSRNLEAFNWEQFYRERGGTFVEQLRNQWRAEFDIVLVDSRTGLSDTGGICTIQLPDVVVAMFTANHQSLYGVRNVMRLAQKARQALAYDRMPLSVLPLPARWGVQEFQETQLWLDRVAEGVQEFYVDWLPRSLSAREVVERVKVPQSDYFGFGEKLAVVEQGTSDPLGMGFIYDKVASFLASDFKDLAALVGADAFSEAVRKAEVATSRTVSPTDKVDYLYDVFVSHDRSMPDFVLDFVGQLKAALPEGDATRIFYDVGEVRGEVWKEHTEDALLRSRVLLAMITPRYNSSPLCARESLTFAERARLTGKPVLVPLIIRGGEFPAWISEFQWLDLREYSTWRTNPSRRPALWHPAIRHLAEMLTNIMAQAPPYDRNWAAAARLQSEAARSQSEYEGGLWPLDLNLIIGDPYTYRDRGPTVNMMCRFSNAVGQAVELNRLELAVTRSGGRAYHLTWHLFYNAYGGEHVKAAGIGSITVGGRSVWEQGVQFRESHAEMPEIWPAGSYEFELRGWANRNTDRNLPDFRTHFRADVGPFVEREMKRWRGAPANTWDKVSDRAIGFPLLVTDIRVVPGKASF